MSQPLTPSNDIRPLNRLQRVWRAVVSAPRLLLPGGEWLLGRPIAGVVATTLRGILRQPGVLLTIAVIVLLLVALPNLTGSDSGTVSHRVQAYQSFALFSLFILTTPLIALLSAAVIVGDMDRKVVQTTLTKPIARWQYVVGKWIALAILSGVLIFGGGAIVYVRAMTLVPPMSTLVDDDGNPSSAEAANLLQHVLVARQQTNYELTDEYAAAVLAREVEELRQLNNDPTMTLTPMQSYRMLQSAREEVFSVPPGERREYTFTGIDLPEGVDRLQFRYTPEPTVRDQVGGQKAPLFFVFGDPKHTGRYSIFRWDLAWTTHTFDIPASVVSPDGALRVVIHNPAFEQRVPIVQTTNPPETPQKIMDFQQLVSFPHDDGLQVLYVAGSHAVNFVRCCIMLFAFVLTIATIGLLFSATVSHPVAVFGSLVALLSLLLIPYIADNRRYLENVAHRHPLDRFTHWLAEGVLFVIPDLSSAIPITTLADGVLISNDSMQTVVFKLIVLASGVGLLLTILLWSRRELANPQGG